MSIFPISIPNFSSFTNHQSAEEKRVAGEIELQSYMNKLLREEMERQLQRLTRPKAGETTKTTTSGAEKASNKEETFASTGDNFAASKANGVEEGKSSTTVNCGESLSPSKIESSNNVDGKSKSASSSSPSTSTSRESSFSAAESKETDKMYAEDGKSGNGKTEDSDGDKTEDAGEKDNKSSSISGIQDKVEGMVLDKAGKSVDFEAAKDVKSNHVHSLTEDEIREQKRAIEVRIGFWNFY